MLSSIVATNFKWLFKFKLKLKFNSAVEPDRFKSLHVANGNHIGQCRHRIFSALQKVLLDTIIIERASRETSWKPVVLVQVRDERLS